MFLIRGIRHIREQKVIWIGRVSVFRMYCLANSQLHCFTEDGVTVAPRFQTLICAMSMSGLGGKE